MEFFLKSYCVEYITCKRDLKKIICITARSDVKNVISGTGTAGAKRKVRRIRSLGVSIAILTFSGG